MTSNAIQVRLPFLYDQSRNIPWSIKTTSESLRHSADSDMRHDIATAHSKALETLEMVTSIESPTTNQAGDHVPGPN